MVGNSVLALEYRERADIYSVNKINRHQGSIPRKPSSSPRFSTLLKEIPPDQVLISMYSTMYSHRIFYFFSFRDSGVGGEVLLSWPELFLFVSARLILFTEIINLSGVFPLALARNKLWR